MAYQNDLVQKTLVGFNENNTEIDSLYTRPTLDCYLLTKYWRFITHDLSPEQVEDFQKAREQLEHYSKIYKIFEYTNLLHETMTTL